MSVYPVELRLEVRPHEEVGRIVGVLEELADDDVQELSRREAYPRMFRGNIHVLFFASINAHLLEEDSNRKVVVGRRARARRLEDCIVMELLAERVEGTRPIVPVDRVGFISYNVSILAGTR